MNIAERPLVKSKVMVLDSAGAHFESLRAFYEECGLVGIRPQHPDPDKVMAILRSNVDLGGIMLHERFGGSGDSALALARVIHQSRPELPMFLRCDEPRSLAGLSEDDAILFRCVYTTDDLDALRRTLEASIFSRVYPNDLVRGISEMTLASLNTFFPDCEVSLETPFLVKDRILCGDLFTMIAIESDWCRGYMMLQSSELALASLQPAGRKTSPDVVSRELQSLMGEATNLAWGSFKNRYVGRGPGGANQTLTQVPIVINLQRRCISFGCDEPQLCLKFTLRKRGVPHPSPVEIMQRFVFNLSWSPADFAENPPADWLVEAGELELF
jgi:hypothetical protein